MATRSFWFKAGEHAHYLSQGRAGHCALPSRATLATGVEVIPLALAKFHLKFSALAALDEHDDFNLNFDFDFFEHRYAVPVR